MIRITYVYIKTTNVFLTRSHSVKAVVVKNIENAGMFCKLIHTKNMACQGFCAKSLPKFYWNVKVRLHDGYILEIRHFLF